MKNNLVSKLYLNTTICQKNGNSTDKYYLSADADSVKNIKNSSISVDTYFRRSLE